MISSKLPNTSHFVIQQGKRHMSQSTSGSLELQKCKKHNMMISHISKAVFFFFCFAHTLIKMSLLNPQTLGYSTCH